MVTSPPDENKKEKFARLKHRGVDVVVINVKTPDDLLSLCWIPKEPEFFHHLGALAGDSLMAEVS